MVSCTYTRQEILAILPARVSDASSLMHALLYICVVIMIILGVLKKYVDDYTGFGSKVHARRDEATFHRGAKAFLGDDCLSERGGNVSYRKNHAVPTAKVAIRYL